MMAGSGEAAVVEALKVARTAFSVAMESARKHDVRVLVDRDDMEAALHHHLTDLSSWSSEISFGDLRMSRSIENHFVPLDVLLMPRRKLIDNEPVRRASFEHLLKEERPSSRVMTPEGQFNDEDEESSGVKGARHLVILGQPGAGKTTSMKALCRRVLLDPEFLPNQLNVPLLVRLRDYSTRQRRPGESKGDKRLLIPKIQEILGLQIGYPSGLQGAEHASKRFSVRDRIVIDALDALECLVVLDGFDEIVYKVRREEILNEFRILCSHLKKSILILTSRTGEYLAHVENAAEYEISPLSEHQMRRFAQTWLGPTPGDEFLRHLARSPYADTAVRPLTIAHLCAIYERIGRIPERPKTIYRKIVTLLLEKWDEERSVRRSSEYSGFETDRKFDFLAHLSYVLTTSTKGSVFSRSAVVRAYQTICGNFGLPPNEAEKVANELEGHSGLFVQAGFELFEFSHKSLQEYLAAEFIGKLPSIPRDKRTMASLPNELAIATAISSSPSAYLTELINERLAGWELGMTFYQIFVPRLLLERPDFDHSPNVGVTLLRLYSEYVKALLGSTQQLSLFVMDRLTEEFDSLSEMIGNRVNMEELMALYERADELEGADGRGVNRLILRGKGPKSSATTESDLSGGSVALPKTLYARDGLVDGNQ